jgi:hypothetical protein
VLIEGVRHAIPDDLRPSTMGTGTAAALAPGAHRRLLAAHAFANWTAHLGRGLRSWLRSVEAAHALIARGLGPGDADLLLRHLADPRTLADGWSEAEKEP